MAEHSVWGAGPPPVEPAAFTNGDPIITANAFYSTAESWYSVGGRLRVPAGHDLPAQVTLTLRTAMYGTLVDLSSPPLRSVTVDVVEGWTVGRWAPLLLPVTVAPDVTVAWICLETGDHYLFAAMPSADPVQATDGANWYLAENGDSQKRAAFREGSGSTTATGAHYAMDALVTNTPDTAVTVEPPAAVGTADAPAPAVSAEARVTAVAATGSATAPAPAVSASVRVSPPTAVGTSMAHAPLLRAAATVSPPAATATGTAPAPHVGLGRDPTPIVTAVTVVPLPPVVVVPRTSTLTVES